MHTPRHPTRSITIMASALLALFLLSFVLGRYGVPLGEVVKILLSRVFSIEQTWTDNMAIAVWNVRLPRILLACLVGCGLSAAGTAYQTVFQNPMAAPDILGASSGACFGAALAILTGQSTVMVTVFAFLASLLSVALVYLVGRRSRGSRVVSLLLAGIMVGSLFSACTSYIKLVADPTNQLPQITYWLMGSLSATRMHTVAVSGMIGWVGLVIPHLSRRLVGNDCRRLLPMACLFGAAFLLLVDDLARTLAATEIPIGILTAFVGAPFFIYLMVKGGDRL